MDEKYGEFIGVDKLHMAILTKDDDSGYTTQAPKYLAPVAEIAGEPEVNKKTTYYDNKAAITYITEGKTDVKVIVSNVPAEMMAELLGKKYDAATGRVYDTGQPNPPDIALGFRYNMGKEGFRYYWYNKGMFSGGAEESISKKEDVDIKTYTLTYTAVTTTKQWTIDGELKSLKRVFADTADEAFDPTDWFTQVQTPDAVGAPPAIVLSTSVPDDADTDIAVDANLTLTYNNAIADYAITVINTATLANIEAEITIDATKKIITINPSSDLSNDTNYAIVISKVTDTYGQSIENTIIDFTTIA